MWPEGNKYLWSLVHKQTCEYHWKLWIIIRGNESGRGCHAFLFTAPRRHGNYSPGAIKRETTVHETHLRKNSSVQSKRCRMEIQNFLFLVVSAYKKYEFVASSAFEFPSSPRGRRKTFSNHFQPTYAPHLISASICDSNRMNNACRGVADKS